MFKRPKNIESAFQHIRQFSLLWLLACGWLCTYTLSKTYNIVTESERKVYILSSGKVLEALAADRKDNLPVEAKDHVRSFHEYFFTLDPDDKVINTNIGRAFYLADGSAKAMYDNLKESGFYAGMIAGNISQQIAVDSIDLDTRSYPYYFRCWATQRIIRPTSMVTRGLLTEGWLRTCGRSDNNPHGFLIERWKIIENKDQKVETR